VLLLLFVAQASGRVEVASADQCVPNGGNFLCSWEANIAPSTFRFFSAPGGNNLRNWIQAGVGDQNGGSVANKCVEIQRGSDGAQTPVACGSGFPSAGVPGGFDPGFLFIVHFASGARTITGAGTSP
jgi:hypothetical protein